MLSESGKGRRWLNRLKGVKGKIDFFIQNVIIALITDGCEIIKLPRLCPLQSTRIHLAFFPPPNEKIKIN